jgi:hypothetical protein
MNELKKIWANINDKVNVFLILSIIFILVNAYFALGLFEVIQEDTSLPFPAVSRRISMDADIEPEEIFEEEEEISFSMLPRRYRILSEVNIFAPPTILKKEDDVARVEEMEMLQDDDNLEGENEDDIIVYRRPRVLPLIEGFTIDGIIIDGRGNGIAIIHEHETGKNYVVKQNEFIRGTNIRVNNISKGRVILSKTGSRDTELTLKKQTMFQYWLDADPEMFNK